MSANRRKNQMHRVLTKWCFVPYCRNTSKNAPNKLFINVPQKPQLREEWFKAINRSIDNIQLHTPLFCCQDHFNVKEDLETYMPIEMLLGHTKLYVKEGVLPHIFGYRKQQFKSMIRHRMSKLFSANIKKDDGTASTSTNTSTELGPGQRVRSPDYQKLRARVIRIRDNRRGQPDRSAMEGPHPGETAFMITVISTPGCRNSSAKTPDKIFVTVPVSQKRREAWFTAVNRDVTEVSAISPRYCCEDHFDMEKDMDNYMEYRLSHVRARMRPEVVPHKYLDGNVPKQPRPRKKKQQQQVSVFVPEVLETVPVQVDVKQEDPLELDETNVLPSDLIDVQMKIEVEENEFVAIKEEEVFPDDDETLP